MPLLAMFFRLICSPMLTVSVQALQVGLCTAVILEVGHDHIGVAAAQVLGDFVEVLAVPAALQEVQSGICHVVAHDEGVGVVAHLLEVVDLGGQHTEDQLVLLAGGIGDLDVCAVQSAQRDGTVQHELHVAGTGSLGASQRDLLRDLGSGHQVLAQGDAVLFQIDHAQLVADSGVVVDEVAQLADHADHLLGHVVAGSSLCAEDIGLGDEVGVGVLLQVQVLGSDVQRLNALNIAAQYLYLKENPNADFIPKTYIFGAKAAPGYYMAKQMIRMICKLGDLINNDPAVRDKLRVVYLEEYCVSLSEHLMPAAEVSEQISLAGTEASGTGNMKFMLNGAITLGTLDGANVEIADAAGKENELIFGMLTPEVNNLKQVGYHPNAFIMGDDVANAALNFLERGWNGENFHEVTENLRSSDPYMVMADFKDYRRAQADLQKPVC